jgi:hypothetical protein
MRISDDAYFYSGVAAVAKCHLTVDLQDRLIQCSDAEELEPDSLVIHAETNAEHVASKVENNSEIATVPAVPQDLPAPEQSTVSAGVHGESKPPVEVGKKCVRFDDGACTVHEITPYSEIFGLHPREFVFDKFYCILPAEGFADVGAAWKRQSGISEEDSEDCDSDEEDFTDTCAWTYEYSM